ncbi:MAG: energy-coupling factor transporter transmembrane protein EcfT [Spirochaetaceae bacterium]|jgi:biotin transport system permease protein/energy-coupling factor transport system permease protein|nr:energy-coupling factor transporter transmembrane protein EcfT [Spirochaetaceae bacterium]
MKAHAVVFRYKRGRSVCHRLPAPVKLALMLCVAVTVMFLPLTAVCAGIVLSAVFAGLCRFTLREQCADIKPACYYALFLFAVNFAANLYAARATGPGRDWLRAALPRADYVLYAARLCLVMQLSALLFRTTTSLQIKETLSAAEAAVRAALKKLPFARKSAQRIAPDAKWAQHAALMLNFIPVLFEIWEKLNRAYRARDGRGGLKKYRILLIALFALSFHCASEKARALAARAPICHGGPRRGFPRGTAYGERRRHPPTGE